MSNIKKYCIYTILYNVGFMFCTGAIMQTFLLQAGFSEKQVYVLNSLMQVMQVVMMLLMTFLSSKIKRVKAVTSVSCSSLSLLAAIFLIGAINPQIIQQWYVITVFIVAGISYVGVGLYTILTYCLPYYTIDMNEYGKMTGISTMLAGIFSFALSFLHTFAVAKFNYMQAMSWFFVLAIVCFSLTTLVCFSLKEIEKQGNEAETTKTDFIDVFKNKDTFLLLIPNFVRGLAAGIMAVITVIAISKGILNEKTSSYVNIVMQISMFGGNFLYVCLYKKLSSTTMLLASTIGVCLFLPFCLFAQTVLFLILFCVAYFFRIIIDTAIPVIVTEIIPQNQIGAFTSIRMLVFTAAQAVATLIITPLVNVIGYTGLLIFASFMQFICGIVYWLVAKRNKKNQNNYALGEKL